MRIIPLCLFILLLPILGQAAGLSVYAASSLTEVLEETVQAYQLSHPDAKIELHFAGSQTLATQIEQGAPADLFIAANTSAMARLQEHGLVATPRPLLHNRLVLAVQPEFKTKIASINDLARPRLLLVIGNRQVPVGNYTRQLFANLAADPDYGGDLIRQIERNIVSEENRVTAIIAKLLLGEVDAGIVYQTDLATESARRLLAIPLPKQHNPLATYPIATTSASRADCAAFTAFLFSPEAQQLFARHGFLPGG